MGVNKFGIRRLLPEMNHGNHDCSTDSLVNGRKAGQAEGTTTTTTGLLSQQVEEVSSLNNSSGIFNGVGLPPEDIDALKLNHKMRLKLCQEDLTRGVGGQYPPDLTGHRGSLNLLLKAGANHELSMSLPNLTAALDTELLNEVNERHVRSSLSNIFDGKQDVCTQQSLSELSKCIKTLSTEDFLQAACCKGGSDANFRPQAHDKKAGTTPSSPGVNMEDIKIEMNGANNRLSAVLENIPLLYIPHTKQLVSVMPQGSTNSSVSSPNGSKSPPTSPVHHSTKHKLPLALHPEGTPQNANNHHGLDAEDMSRNRTENGHISPGKVDTSPLASSSLLPSHQSYSNLDSSLNDSQTNLLNCSEGDVNFTLSQDSDASSTCRSEHTVIHQEDFPTSASSQGRKDSRTVDFDDEEENLECLSKVSLDQDDSPRSTIERTNTMGSLSRADGSSFSSISSISTATDFSASAASCSDDYLELKNCGDVDESGFMEVNLHSRNTFERSRNSSQDSGIDEKLCLGAKPKRRGLSSFFARSDAPLFTDCQPSILKNIFSRKATKEPGEPASGSGGSSSSSSSSSTGSSTGPGWRLFGRIPPKQIPQKDTQEITREYQTKVKVPHPGAPRGKRPDVEAPSTTALILENRPSNLPSKDPEEELRHRIEYEAMIEASKKREQREAKLRKKQQQQQLKQEEALAAALRVWNNDILPNWDNSKNSKKARDLWWHGIPPAVRGKVWQLAIGNELNLTPELYEICLNRAKDRLKLMQDAGDSDSICSQVSEPSSSKEGSVEVIKLDVSRTFPQLCIFQKGGPYYELLQGLLGAYACYRPDVGYVQGMSFIAAVLLLNMEVDDAFICFANLLNRPCQIAFFRLDESLMKSYFLTYEEFFKENLPRLFAVFQKQGLTPDLYIIDWMFTLYAKSLPFDVASRVWDVFCRDGEEFLFRTALGILRMYEDILLSLDFIHLAQFLTKLPENIPSDTLFRSIDSINMVIDKKRFAQVFTQFREPKET